MAKLFSIQTQNVQRGQILGSAWKNKGGYIGITLRGYITDPQGEREEVKETVLTIKTAKNHYELALGGYDRQKKWTQDKAKMLLAPNNQKKPDSRDPDFRVFGYPKPE